MIWTIRLLIAMLCLSSAVFGQGAGTIQTGYVALTPVVGFGDGLSIIGRIKQQAGDVSVHSTVWSEPVAVRTTLVVTSDTRSGLDTGIALVNPNEFPAEIILTLSNDKGSVVGTRTLTLERRRQISRFVSELFGGPAERLGNGLLSISSTLPLGITGLLFQGQTFSPIPKMGFANTPALLLPQFAAGGGWSTNVVIANASLLEQVVRIDFFRPNGTTLRTINNVSLPAGGVVSFSIGN